MCRQRSARAITTTTSSGAARRKAMRRPIMNSLSLSDDRNGIVRATGAGARLVVLPARKDSIRASNLGSYLNAMLTSECAILSEGPGSSDVLDGRALVVPREDRRTTAECGYRYALALGGEQELYQRILECLNLPGRATRT